MTWKRYVRGRGCARRTPTMILTVVVAIVAAVPLFGQDYSTKGGSSWIDHHEVVSPLVSDVMVDGERWVTGSAAYEPAGRLIHEQNAEVAYPVQLSTRAWRRRLGRLEYRILREDGTERAFSGDLYDTTEKGIYYSAATGQPLFSSEDKYDSGTGWPSFTRPIAPDAVAYHWDTGLFSRRIEVVDSLSGSHLGHVFSDGPQPTGQRYCMNSAALIFVPEGGEPPELLLPQ